MLTPDFHQHRWQSRMCPDRSSCFAFGGIRRAYQKLLLPDEIIMGDCYQRQLMNLSRSLKITRPEYSKRCGKVIFQHYKARLHVAKTRQGNLEALSQCMLPHPLYNPDITPPDYHPFRSMIHSLADENFCSYQEGKKQVDSGNTLKTEEPFPRGIRMLPERLGKSSS